jgi:hypothetical protein
MLPQQTERAIEVGTPRGQHSAVTSRQQLSRMK